MTCSELLVNVSSLIIGDHSVILRHFQQVETAPCRACLNPLHTRVKCKAAEGRIEELRASRQRNYVVVTPAHTLPLFESCTTVADLDQALFCVMVDDRFNLIYEGKLLIFLLYPGISGK